MKEKKAAQKLITLLKSKTSQGLQAEVKFCKRKKVLTIQGQEVSGRFIKKAVFAGRNPATLISLAVEHYQQCVSESDKLRSQQQKSDSLIAANC